MPAPNPTDLPLEESLVMIYAANREFTVYLPDWTFPSLNRALSFASPLVGLLAAALLLGLSVASLGEKASDVPTALKKELDFGKKTIGFLYQRLSPDSKELRSLGLARGKFSLPRDSVLWLCLSKAGLEKPIVWTQNLHENDIAELDLSRTRASDEDLAAIAAKFSGLKKLDLRDCKVSDKGLQALSGMKKS